MFDHISVKNLNKSLKVVILEGSHNHLFSEDICIQPEGLQLRCRKNERVRLGTKMFSGKKDDCRRTNFVSIAFKCP